MSKQQNCQNKVWTKNVTHITENINTNLYRKLQQIQIIYEISMK